VDFRPVKNTLTYSPGLARCDFYFIFPRPKFARKGQRFQDVEEIKTNAATEPEARTSEPFQKDSRKTARSLGTTVYLPEESISSNNVWPNVCVFPWTDLACIYVCVCWLFCRLAALWARRLIEIACPSVFRFESMRTGQGVGLYAFRRYVHNDSVPENYRAAGPLHCPTDEHALRLIPCAGVSSHPLTFPFEL